MFLHISHPPAVYILVLEVQYCLHTRPSSVTVVSGGLSLGAYQHPAGTQWDPSARTGADFRQSLAFLQVSHPPVLYTLVLAVWRFLHKRPSGVPGVSEGLSSDAYRHSEGTQRDPSARTAGDFGQSLASPHVSHLPVLYIQVLTVRRLLNTRPPDVPGACVVLRSDAYRHSEGPGCPNCRGIRSIAGVSACLASASALHTSAGSAASSAHVTPRWAWGV